MDNFGNPTDRDVHGNSTNTDTWGNNSNADSWGNPPADVHGNYSPPDPSPADDGGGLLDAILSIFG